MALLVGAWIKTASACQPRRLELEIIETSLLENQQAQLATIRQLKNLGIFLALDDFATGYSGVTQNRILPSATCRASGKRLGGQHDLDA
ncbi:EAL domain-containing protein [Bradyrhizobium sp.]|uniref:EAL domain-containing protein n=1 Tax=Bradyrhizobium sp. TaxID=376 RepID=UPI0026213386|nr:EAL domain-containing protein [Bradyrhizobium sp.]